MQLRDHMKLDAGTAADSEETQTEVCQLWSNSDPYGLHPWEKFILSKILLIDFRIRLKDIAHPWSQTTSPTLLWSFSYIFHSLPKKISDLCL